MSRLVSFCLPPRSALSCPLTTMKRLAVILCVLLAPGILPGQGLRFSNHREVQIPPYATLRIGPFFSTARFTQSVGYRYTRGRGRGTDYLFRNERSTIREDGEEFPMISTLTFRNYLLITRRMDVDASVSMSYQHYPLGTQEDVFDISLVDEGIYGNLSMGIMFTPFLRGTVYDSFVYKTDYVDTRGVIDEYGGERYEYISNRVGLNMDWLLARDKNIGLSASRYDVWPQSKEFADQELSSHHEGVVYEHRISPIVIMGARADFYQTDYAVPERADHEVQAYTAFVRLDPSIGVQDRTGLGIRLTDVSTLTVGIGYVFGYASSTRLVARDVSTATDDVSTQSVDQGERDVETVTGFATLETHLRKDLTHQFSYSRSVRDGFFSSAEIVDLYGYRITWNGAATTASAFSNFSQVKPSRADDFMYSTWASGLQFAYPLVDYITLNGSTVYTDRRSRAPDEAVEDLRVDELESRSDYQTWASRIGTSFGIMRELRFNTYVEHVERYSDSDDLEYSRDTFGANLVYSHQF